MIQILNILFLALLFFYVTVCLQSLKESQPYLIVTILVIVKKYVILPHYKQIFITFSGFMCLTT